MSEEKKPDTPFVTGGVYEQHIGPNRREGILFAGETTPLGKRRGLMRVAGYQDEPVVESDSALNNWKLIKAPVEFSLLQDAEAKMVEAMGKYDAVRTELAQLKAQLKKLKEDLGEDLNDALRELAELRSGLPPVPAPVAAEAAVVPVQALNVASAEVSPTVSAQGEASSEGPGGQPSDPLEALSAVRGRVRR